MMSRYTVHCDFQDDDNGLSTPAAEQYDGSHVAGGDNAERSSSARDQQRLEEGASGTSDSSGGWPVSIDDLPDEVLIQVFSHLSFCELTEVVQKVCTRWRRLSQDPELWEDKEYCISFSSGYLTDTIKYCKTDLEAVQTFRDCPNLRRVSMQRGAKARVLRALCSSCRRLGELRLHHTQKLSLKVLKNLVEKCSRIHTLRISNELLKFQKFAEAVSQFQHLCVLELDEHTIQFMPTPTPLLRPLGEGCPQLTDVDFQLTTLDIDDLRYFLNAKRNSLKSIGIKWTMQNRKSVLPLLTDCAGSLERLQLYWYDIEPEEGRDAFSALGCLKNLQELKMAITDPPPPGTAALAFNGGLPQLRVLDLQDGSGLDDEAVVAVSRGCPALRELNLRGAERLTDGAFSQVHRLQLLQKLDLSDCRALSGGLMPHLCRLPRLHTLVMEGLDCLQLQPGLDSILEMSSIRCLTLNYSTLTGMPFDKFPDKLINLRELHICRCQWNSGAIAILTECMPGLQIYVQTLTQVPIPHVMVEGPEDAMEFVEEEYVEELSDRELGDISESDEDIDSFG